MGRWSLLRVSITAHCVYVAILAETNVRSIALDAPLLLLMNFGLSPYIDIILYFSIHSTIIPSWSLVVPPHSVL